MATDAPIRPAPALALCFALPPLPGCVHVLYSMTQPAGVPVDALLGLLFGLLWTMLVTSVPPLRRFAAELAAWLLARVSFGAWIALCALSGLLATQNEFSAAWSGVLALVLSLTVLSGARTWRDRRARFFRAWIVAAGIALFLVVLDRTAGAYFLARKSHNSIFLAHDEILGWKLRPLLDVEREFETYVSRETVNARGFRTALRPYEKPAGTLRVVLLGDSHTEAYTVSDDQTYAVELERLLSARRGGPVEVISLGVGGFSTDQELLAYVHEGRRYAPDLVVLQFCPNDPQFNMLDRYWRGLKPWFQRHGDMLLLQGVPVPDRRSSGLTKHALLRGSNFAMIAEGALSRFALTKDEQRSDKEEAWRVTELLIRDLAAWVRQDGAALSVFNSNPDEDEPDSRLRALLERRGIAFLDIEPAFGGDIGAHRVEEDKHWNPRGHRAVAERLAELLGPEIER